MPVQVIENNVHLDKKTGKECRSAVWIEGLNGQISCKVCGHVIK